MATAFISWRVRERATCSLKFQPQEGKSPTSTCLTRVLSSPPSLLMVPSYWAASISGTLRGGRFGDCPCLRVPLVDWVTSLVTTLLGLPMGDWCLHRET